MNTHHFDERAATWDDDPAKVERATSVAAVIADAIDIPPGTTLLEVGAGTGLVATALRPHVGAIALSDPSVGMRTVMIGKSADPGHPLAGARILDVDLAEHSGASPATADRFGLVVAVLVLHHVPDIDHALATLVNHTEDGGHVAVVDLETEDGSFHDSDFDGHHGFDPPDIVDRLARLGLVDLLTRRAGTVVKEHGEFGLFIATGRRPI